MWVTVKDVKDRWLDDSDDLPSDEILETFIDDIEEQLIKKFPKLDERIDNGDPTLKFVKGAVSRIIIEFLQTKGTPYSQITQSYTGAASQSITYSSSKARYSLELRDSDYALFAPSDNSGKVIGLDLAKRIKTNWDTLGYFRRF